MAMNRAAKIVGQLQLNDCAFMDNVKPAPADAILGVAQAFARDTDPRKVNVSVGAYRTEEGKPLVLQCVKEAEALLVKDGSLNKEYLAQRGDNEFCALSTALLFGKTCKAIVEKRVACVQTLSGTGSLRVGAEFISRFLPGRKILLSNPTWGTHKSILEHAGLEAQCGTYRYWDEKARGLNITGMLADIASCPMGTIIMFHAAAHNPTGVDPTHDQWKLISQACHANGIICWFDSAYQGFATGDLDKDAFAIKHFTDLGHPVMCSQSFAKNFGLYGERIGSFSVVCANPTQVEPVLSQLDVIIRNLYSNPPKHGAYIVSTILKDARLSQMWRDELLAMSVRIQDMRKRLRQEIEALQTPGDWSHLTTQIGMFSFTGLNPVQCKSMVEKHHVYMLGNGRISMAGVNTKNVAYMASAINDVVRNAK